MPSVAICAYRRDIITVNFATIAQFTSSGVLKSSVRPASIAVIAGSAFGNEEIEASGKYLLVKVLNVASGRCHDYNTEVIGYTPTGTVDSTFSRPLFNFAGVVGCGISDPSRE